MKYFTQDARKYRAAIKQAVLVTDHESSEPWSTLKLQHVAVTPEGFSYKTVGLSLVLPCAFTV